MRRPHYNPTHYNPKSAAQWAGLLTVAIFLSSLFMAGSASAEPSFTVREGLKCSTCHVNHTGGGKRTAYAQTYMQTRMPMNPGEVREGGFFHGYLNERVSIGADIRTALIYREDQDLPGSHQFNQPKSSCAGCHGGYEGKRAEIHVQLEMVPTLASIVVSQNLLPSTESREVYGIVEDLPLRGYAKIGTFRLPSGLNNTWDAPLVHGEVGSGGALVPGWSGLRGDGVEFGFEPGPLALSVSITNASDLTAAPKAKRLGVQAMAVMDPVTLGYLMYDDPLTDADSRTLSGVMLGLAVGRFTLLGQTDILTTPADTGEVSEQLYLGQVDFLFTRGQSMKLQYEAYDPDTSVDNNIRDRTSIVYEPFVTPYLQWRLGTRIRNGPVEEPGANGKDYFIEAHLMY